MATRRRRLARRGRNLRQPRRRNTHSHILRVHPQHDEAHQVRLGAPSPLSQRPQVLALVGVTLYRAVLPLIDDTAGRARATGTVLGSQPHLVHGAQLFVLPNPSGRNANFSYAEMLEAFAALKRVL